MILILLCFVYVPSIISRPGNYFHFETNAAGVVSSSRVVFTRNVLGELPQFYFMIMKFNLYHPLQPITPLATTFCWHLALTFVLFHYLALLRCNLHQNGDESPITSRSNPTGRKASTELLKIFGASGISKSTRPRGIYAKEALFQSTAAAHSILRTCRCKGRLFKLASGIRFTIFMVIDRLTRVLGSELKTSDVIRESLRALLLSK